MIDVLICESKDFYETTADGHAEYAEHGKDIVCAGATTLMYALDNVLKEEDSITQKLINGSFAIKCKRTPETENYIKMFKAGLELISRQYPENVSVKIIKK